jgi:hypothetical protein
MRRSEHKQTGLAIDGDACPPSPTLPAKAEASRFSFHLPFLRQLQSISIQRTLAPPPSPNPSQSAWHDGSTSVASITFPTFSPVVKQDASEEIADVGRPWLDEDSCAPTSETHETPEMVELDVQSLDDNDDGTYRLGYRENAATPSSKFGSSSSSLLILGGSRDITLGIYSKLYTPDQAASLLSTVRSPLSTLAIT